MSDNPKTLSGFLDIFEGRLNKLRDTLKKELEKTKSERCRTTIKSVLRDARRLKKVVKQGREEHKQNCPHCGGKI